MWFMCGFLFEEEMFDDEFVELNTMEQVLLNQVRFSSSFT